MSETQPIFVVSLRDLRIASKTGHVIRIKKAVRTAIPPFLLEEAMGLGCVPADEADLTALQSAQDAHKTRVDAAHDKILVAVEQLVAQNDALQFTANGVPMVKSVEALVGFDITSDDRDRAWAEFSNRTA